MECEAAACARCGRVAPSRELSVWTERVRVRTYAPAERAFRYDHRRHCYAVCPPCFQRLADSDGLFGFERRRGLLILLTAVMLAIIAAAAIPYLIPTLLSAFWRG